MQLPNNAAAYVPEEKLINYLLNMDHPIGGSKARLLAGHGFTIANSAYGGTLLVGVTDTGGIYDPLTGAQVIASSSSWMAICPHHAGQR